MNETIAYQWSEELARKSLAAYYRHKVGRLWLFNLAGILFFGLGLFFCFMVKDYRGWVLCFVGALLFFRFLKMQMEIRRLAHDATRLVDDPQVTVTLTDQALSVVSKNSSRTLEWFRLSHAVESGEFLLLFAGKLLFACFPLDLFSEPQRQFIREKIGITNRK
jgi:hypothetical protein